jgi:hypothetical protein
MQADIKVIADSQTALGGIMQAAVSSSAQNGFIGFRVVLEKQPLQY